jgi:Asp-tRNA(Asn)/Glu-tRNA(Gln) amidotransferase A subunit family amidase
MVPVATATDAGGSSRGPAAACGLVGLKPTNGLIGRATAPTWLDLGTDGILAPSVADAQLLLSVMAGPQPGDVGASRWTPRVEPALPSRLLIAPRIQPAGPLPPDVDASFRDAVRRLESGLRLPMEEVDPAAIFPGPHHPDDDSLTILGPETVAWLGRERVVRERARLDPFFECYLDEALAVTLDEYLAARRRRFDHARVLDALLGEDRVLVTPTLNTQGLLADGSVPGGDAPTNAGANTNPHNVTGHPSISVPAGMQPNGLPFGLLFTAPRWRDDLLLRVAAAWEQIASWPRTAPGYEPFG